MSHLSPRDLSGMGDSMRVGPQYQMPTSRAVPLIERGPHGAPLYPPSMTTPGGFVFWNQWDSGDWNALNTGGPRSRAPKQEILSLLGMGELAKPEATMAEKSKWTSLSKELHTQAQTVGTSLLPPIISQAKALAEVVNTHQSWDDGFLGAWDSQQRITIRARQALTIAQSRLQGSPVPAGATAPIPKPSTASEFPGSVATVAREDVASVVEAAKKYTEQVKKDQTSYMVGLGLLGLGALFVYGASQGIGAGVGRRIAR